MACGVRNAVPPPHIHSTILQHENNALNRANGKDCLIFCVCDFFDRCIKQFYIRGKLCDLSCIKCSHVSLISQMLAPSN